MQVGADRFPALARTAEASERARPWTLMSSIWSDYDRHQQQADHQIPVVVLERA